ncbi:MAG: hypothetical protein H6662_14285 [Ardenticatenaceae bacterium]|nr:hypothetical protein [Ardenticatenaceae bacterium]
MSSLEEGSAPSGGQYVIQRSTYSLAGQAVAVRVTGDLDIANDGLFYLYSDHLGSASAIQRDGGVSAPIVTRYLPFGGYRTGSGPNEVTDRGFTRQRENMADLGLYYYNARWYSPLVGRFLSADTLVPDPQNPQQYNRYTYSLNNPLKYIDPSGHCVENYQAGSEDFQTCMDGWSSLMNYLSDLHYGPGGNGVFPNEWTTELLMTANIASIEGLMRAYDIDYGYTSQVMASRNAQSEPTGWMRNEYMYRERPCQYWESCYEPQPAFDFVSGTFSAGPGYGGTFSLIKDRYGNIYINLGFQYGSPGVSGSLTGGDVVDSNLIPVVLSEPEMEKALIGLSEGAGGGAGAGGAMSHSPGPNNLGTLQVGVFTPGFTAVPFSGAFLFYDAGSSRPWFWQKPNKGNNIKIKGG